VPACWAQYSDNQPTNNSLAAWRSVTGQETLDGNDVGFEYDPCLANPGYGGTIGDPCNLASLAAYKLQSNSPLIEAGLSLQSLFGIDAGGQDYFGTPIPVGDQFDVGAHEYRNIADFNYDNKVNFLDYAKLAAAWETSLGEIGFNDVYDLHDDDAIDVTDLWIFLADWLWEVGP